MRQRLLRRSRWRSAQQARACRRSIVARCVAVAATAVVERDGDLVAALGGAARVRGSGSRRLPVGLPLPPFILRPAASSAAFASSRFMPVRSGTVVPLPLLVKTRIVVPRPAWPEGSVPETVPAGRFESCWPPSSKTKPAASIACLAASSDSPATCGHVDQHLLEGARVGLGEVVAAVLVVGELHDRGPDAVTCRRRGAAVEAEVAEVRRRRRRCRPRPRSRPWCSRRSSRCPSRRRWYRSCRCAAMPVPGSDAVAVPPPANVFCIA